MLVKEYQQYIYEKYGTDEQMLLIWRLLKLKMKLRYLRRIKLG